MKDIVQLYKNEGWEVVEKEDKHIVIAYGNEFPLRHPVQIYLSLYMTENNPDLKFQFMKKAHDILWPKHIKTWHYWTERRFRTHCENWNYISLAGGASTAKSMDAAKIVLLFWLANPTQRGAVIASTTLESLGARIWGYTTNLLSSMAIKLPFQYLGGNSPKILFPKKRTENEIRDTIHGIFAVAAKSGEDEKAISSWIGRHPNDALMVVLDESTDMNAAVLKAFANLDSGGKPFQCIGIGNSNSIFDLHGALSTPKHEKGWGSVSPTDIKWETTQKNGICLFFSCYESPAIHEPDPEKKKLLSKFLITQEQIDEKKKTYGDDSDLFWRFVIGFWKATGTDNVIVSKEFLESFNTKKTPEYGGIYPLRIVGGLDPSFSTGGDDCILRLAVLGVDVEGRIVLDFRKDELIFKIQIQRSLTDATEMQIAKQVQQILDSHGCPLENICVDATGQGRALSSVIQLHMKALKSPLKIYSTKIGDTQRKSFDVTIKSSYELWYALRSFVQTEQIRGLDHETITQLTSRKIELKGGKYTLESKADYKKRMGAVNPAFAHSPDKADAAALCVQSAILNFGFSVGARKQVQQEGLPFNEKYWVFQQEKMHKAAQDKFNKQVVVGLPTMSFLHNELSLLKP